MVLSLFAFLLVLGITFMHSIFGLFSGVINALCAISAMAITFGFFDQVTALVTEQQLHPSYTLPCCFVGMFIVSHVALRLLADNLIRGNVRMPTWADWGGGALCGFVIGQITVGMLVLSFLLLPFGGRVMMFSRVEREEFENEQNPLDKVEFNENHVAWFLRPDEFTVGLFNTLSSGSLSSKTSFASVYPNFADWVFWTGNTVQHESFTAPIRDDQGDGFGTKGVSVQEWWEVKTPMQVRYRWKLPSREMRLENTRAFEYIDDYKPSDPGEKLIGMRLTLPVASADRGKGVSAFHRFRPTMIRVVGEVRGTPKQYFARILGGADPDTDAYRLADIDNNFAIQANSDVPLDVFFEVDEAFEPHFVEYRRYARAPVTAANMAKNPPDGRLFYAGAEGSGSSSGGHGVTRFIDAIIEDGTGQKDDLPLRATRNALATAGSDLEFDGDALKSGRFFGRTRSLRGSGPGSVGTLAVPSGQRCFQLKCKAREARSLAGQVFNFVGATVNQYFALDDKGTRHQLAGYYAIVNRRNENYIEFYLAGDIDSAAFRGMLDFKEITSNELREGDTEIGLIFFVPPGVTIMQVVNQAGQGVPLGRNDEGYKIGD